MNSKSSTNVGEWASPERSISRSRRGHQRFKKPQISLGKERKYSPAKSWKWISHVSFFSYRFTIEMFIILTQLGFCCVYFVFIASSLKQVNFHGRDTASLRGTGSNIHRPSRRGHFTSTKSVINEVSREGARGDGQEQLASCLGNRSISK